MMIKIYSPNDELELSIIRGVLDAEGIHYFVHNDYFGSMRVGPQIDLLNKKTIQVAPEDADRTKEIISNLLEVQLPEEEEENAPARVKGAARYTWQTTLTHPPTSRHYTQNIGSKPFP